MSLFRLYLTPDTDLHVEWTVGANLRPAQPLLKLSARLEGSRGSWLKLWRETGFVSFFFLRSIPLFIVIMWFITREAFYIPPWQFTHIFSNILKFDAEKKKGNKLRKHEGKGGGGTS